MFDQLFTQPWVVARHTSAPFAEERARYLDYCKRRGDTRATLLLKAQELLWIARKLKKYPDLEISMMQLWGAAAHWKDRESACGRKLNAQWTSRRFIDVAQAWLRYLGHLRKAATQSVAIEASQYSEFLPPISSDRPASCDKREYRPGLDVFDSDIAQGAAKCSKRVGIGTKAHAERTLVVDIDIYEIA